MSLALLFHYSLKLSWIYLEQIIVLHHQGVFTSSLQHFTFHLQRSLVTDTKRLTSNINRTV